MGEAKHVLDKQEEDHDHTHRESRFGNQTLQQEEGAKTREQKQQRGSQEMPKLKGADMPL